PLSPKPRPQGPRSDAADKSNEDHWSRLASELGLESEPQASPNRASAAAPRPEPEEPAESISHIDDEAESESAAPQRGRRRRAAAAEREAETTALTEGEPPAEPDLLDDEPPARPRRGRKSAEDEAETPAEV